MQKLLFFSAFILPGVILTANEQQENDPGFSGGDISLEVNFYSLKVAFITINKHFWLCTYYNQENNDVIIRFRDTINGDIRLGFIF